MIEIYPTLSTAIGWMAAGDIGWCVLIIEHIIKHGSLGASLLLDAFDGVFRWGDIVFSIYYNYENLSCPFHCHWGVGWDQLQQAPLDDAFYK